jgi:poly-beta-1,6-N-acetyl-D-glucosamine synthase
MKWLFWIAAALVAYTYIGYLGVLRLRLLWRFRPVLRGKNTPPVSVVMVVRNEEQILEAKLQNLMTLDYPLHQIVVVSDGSTDRTESILREHADDARLLTVFKQISEGKAAGLNDALQLAEGEIVLFTDARQTIEPQAVRLLMENFSDPDVGCASGELMLGDPSEGESGQGLGLYWRVEKRVRELESASGSVMGATGALYAVRRELLTEVPPGTILDDVYLPMQVVRQGKRVIFDGRARAWDQANLGTKREFERKVRTLSGNFQLVQLEPWLLSGENPERFEFISHKLIRLVSPFALAAVLVASFFLPQPVYRVALAAQLVLYALSVLAMWPVAIGPLRRVADAALTFVILNAAALVAFSNFITGRKVAWTR